MAFNSNLYDQIAGSFVPGEKNPGAVAEDAYLKANAQAKAQQAVKAGPTSFWERIQQYGIETARQTKQAFETSATGIARMLPGGTNDIKAQAKEANQATQQQKTYTGLFKAGKINHGQYQKLMTAAGKTAGSASRAVTKEQLPTTGQFLGSLGIVASFGIPGLGKAAESGGAALLKTVGFQTVKDLASEAGIQTAEKGSIELAKEVAATKIGQQALRKATQGGLARAALKNGAKWAAGGAAFGAAGSYASSPQAPSLHTVFHNAWQNAAAFGAFGVAGKVFARGAGALLDHLKGGGKPSGAPPLEGEAPSPGAKAGMQSLSRAEQIAKTPRKISVADQTPEATKLTRISDQQFQQKFNDLSKQYSEEMKALKSGVKNVEVTPKEGVKPAGGAERIKVKVNPQTKAIDGYTSSEQMVKDMADTYKQIESGMQGGQLVHDGERYGYGKKRVTEHSPFYRDYYAEHKRPPSNQAWEDFARQELKSGKAPWGASDTYKQLVHQENGSLNVKNPPKGGAKIHVKGATPVTEASRVTKSTMNMRQMILARAIDAKYEGKLNALLDEYHGVKPGTDHYRVVSEKPEEPNLTAEAVAAENKAIKAREKAQGKPEKTTAKEKLTKAAKAKSKKGGANTAKTEKGNVAQHASKEKSSFESMLKFPEFKDAVNKDPALKVQVDKIIAEEKGSGYTTADKLKTQREILKDAQANLKKAKKPEDKTTLEFVVKKAKENISKLEGHDNNKINSIIGEGGTHYERQARLEKTPNKDIIRYYHDSHGYPSKTGFEGWLQTNIYDKAKAKSLLADYEKYSPAETKTAAKEKLLPSKNSALPVTGNPKIDKIIQEAEPYKSMVPGNEDHVGDILKSYPKFSAKNIDKAIAHYKSNLETSIKRYQELQDKGIKAVNEYDINIAAGGNAEQALSGAKELVGNHIHYDAGVIKRLEMGNIPEKIKLAGKGGSGYMSRETFLGEKAAPPRQIEDLTPPPEAPPAAKRIYQGVRGYMDKVKVTNPIHKSYEQDRWKLDSTRKRRLTNAATLLQKMKGVSKEDKAAVWAYREAKGAGLATKPLTESQQALHDTITAITGDTNKMKGELKKLKVPGYSGEYAADAGNHRIAIEKGTALERFMSGTQKVPISGRSLRTTMSSGHGRTWFALTDEAGNRKIVTIKSNTLTNKLTGKAIRRDNMVTEWKDGKPTELGQVQKANQPVVQNYFDPAQREAINKVLDNIGVTSKRFVKAKRGSGLGGRRAGVSFTGMSRIHVKAAATDSVLAHELGHQLDEKYGLQDMFNARYNKELRALTDATGGTKSYVRKGEEKIANMFEAYLQAPHLFQEVAPNTYKDLRNFLTEHPELHPLRDVKTSIVLGSEKVMDEPQYIKGTFVDKTGKRWTIGEATSAEIGKAGNTQYFEDPLTTAVIDHVETANALQSAKILDGWKNSPDFANIAQKVGEGNPPKGWITTRLPQMQGYYFDPKVAHVLDDIYGQIKDRSAALQLLNHAVRNTIVAIPIRHNLNEVGFYFTDRGITGLLTPHKAYNSLIKAYNEVMNQGDFYRKVVDQGFNFMYQDDHAFGDAVNQQMNSLLSNDAATSRLAADARMSPVKLRQVWNDVQHKGVWFQQDVLNLARIMERYDKNGGNLEQAVADTARFNPQYRVPSEVAGSRVASQILRNNNLMFFGSYHYDQWKVLANMMGDLAGRSGKAAAVEAANKAAALALGVWVTSSLIDKGLQKLSGDPNAYTKAFGVLDLPQQVWEVATGQKTVDTFMKSQLFPSFGLQTFAQLFENRDFFTGKMIYDTSMSNADQVKQVGSWLWKQLPFDQQAGNISKGHSAAAAAAALSLGARYPKNSAATNELNSLKYDTLPNVQSAAKKQAQSGDTAGAQKTISQYDKLVLNAAKKALKEAGKPIPPDDQLIKTLRKNQYYYQPQQKTIDKWKSERHTTSILDQL